jgi:AcrR family transcriptional regulator
MNKLLSYHHQRCTVYTFDDVHCTPSRKHDCILLCKEVDYLTMPYPSKTNHKEILSVALELLEREGLEALSMRTLAAKLEVVPNALYRYYPDRDALKAALGLEGAVRLHLALARASKGKPPKATLLAVAKAYLNFAENHPHLYDLTMRNHPSLEGHPENYANLWLFVVTLTSQFTGEANDDNAAVALWSFLHGCVGLERANLLGDHKPKHGVEVGLEALLVGFKEKRKDL